MRKAFFIVNCLFVLSFVSNLAAAQSGGPPAPRRQSVITSMDISYDLKNASLHVEAVHPSDNWEIDYIRMMTVSVNGQVMVTNNYYHQTTAEGFSEDVPITAQVGDVITAVLYCTGGSSKSEDLTVVEPGTDPSDQGTDTGADNSTTDNSTTDNSSTEGSTNSATNSTANSTTGN